MGSVCCTNGETLGRWCNQYEFIGLDAGLSYFLCVSMAPVTRSGSVEFVWPWHSIRGMSAIFNSRFLTFDF